MKTGISLQELAAEIERQSAAKKDYIADTRKLSFFTSGKNVDAAIEGVDVYRIGGIADKQMNSWASVPQAYADRLRGSAPELYAEQMNHWFAQNPERRTIRTLDGQLRAFLSDKYRPLDNEELAQAVLPVLGEMGCSVESCAITERRLYIKAVCPRVQGEISRGDVVQSGVIISNSEVGHGSLSIAPLVYRLVCKNGLIVADQKRRKYHTGQRADIDGEVWEMFQDETRKKTDEAVWMQLRDITRSALAGAIFEQAVDKMRQSQSDEVSNPANVPAVVEAMAKKYGMGKEEGHGILGHLIAGGDLSRFGLLNAVTRYAQDVESYDRSTELEAIGGRILEMNAREWSAVQA